MVEVLEKCTFCGAVSADTQQTVDDELICPDCLDEGNVVPCRECNELTPRHDFTTTHDGVQLCPFCFVHHTHRCLNCANTYYSGRFIWLDSSSRALCRYCAERGDYFVCGGCYAWHLVEEQYIDDDLPYCENCYSARLNIIHNYSYKPHHSFYGQGPLFLGVELEVESGPQDREITAERIARKGIYLKEDATIEDGFEIVSHPASLDYHLYDFGWDNILQTLRNDGFTSHNADACGLHVHLSRLAFGKSNRERKINIFKLILIIERFWNEMLRFSRRTEEQIGEYARRYLNAYEELSFDSISVNAVVTDSRFMAVNIQNFDTIELRLWRGTLIQETFFATLQFSQFLVNSVVSLTLEEVQDLTWNKLMAMIDETDYQELKDYLKRRHLIQNIN